MRKKFTKQQYQLISGFGVITKDMATKAGFRTAKEAKEARMDIREVQEERIELQIKYLSNQASAYEQYLKKRGEQIFKIMDCPMYYKLNYRFGEAFEFKLYYDTDWSIYAKSYSYPARVHCYVITIPRTGIMLQDFDGIETTYTNSRTIGEITILTGGHMLTLKRGRMDLNVIPVAVALSQAKYNEVTRQWEYAHAAHGQNAEQALNALRKKIRKVQKVKKFKLTLDTLISAPMSQKFTGACPAGTNAWLQEHDLDRETKITVRELLTILEPSDYGYHKIIKILTDNGIEV